MGPEKGGVFERVSWRFLQSFEKHLLLYHIKCLDEPNGLNPFPLQFYSDDLQRGTDATSTESDVQRT